MHLDPWELGQCHQNHCSTYQCAHSGVAGGFGFGGEAFLLALAGDDDAVAEFDEGGLR